MGGVTLDMSALDRVPQHAWDHLAGRRIYFGHQSVGYDVIRGLETILAQRPGIRLRVVESADPRTLERSCLAHSKNGSNTDPQSKFQAFANYLGAGGGDLAEVALYKLCYADINDRTAPAAVFEAYEAAIGTLQSRFRRVRILHVTVPLTTIPGGPRRTIKRWLGRPNWAAQQNARREEYNRMLLERFGDSVFDLARVESTRPDGVRHVFRQGGRDHPGLCPDYSEDGGHLSSLGQLVAAREFLLWLQGVAA
jgi:hypothetical protein